MVIIALIMGLVGTSISRSVSATEARVAPRNLVASLRYTRARAIIDKKEQVFQVDTENRSFKHRNQTGRKFPQTVFRYVQGPEGDSGQAS